MVGSGAISNPTEGKDKSLKFLRILEPTFARIITSALSISFHGIFFHLQIHLTVSDALLAQMIKVNSHVHWPLPLRVWLVHGAAVAGLPCAGCWTEVSVGKLEFVLKMWPYS